MKIRISEQFIGILVAALIIGVVATCIHFMNRSDNARRNTFKQRQERKEMQDSLMRSVAERDSLRAVWAKQKHERDSLRPIWEEQRREREKKRAQWEREKAIRDSIRYAQEHIEIILQPFDPNTADSTTLVHLGLRPWMAKSVGRYRDKGGRFRKKEDFRNVYGMTDSLFSALEPYIQISPDTTLASTNNYIIKKDTILNLNTADTLELCYIRGIGFYTAKNIIRYRKSMGGFVSVEQLRELKPPIQNMDSIIPHFIADPTSINLLYINRLSVDAMVRHPYLSFSQAKAIRDRRHRKGAIRSEEELKALKSDHQLVFTEEDLARLRPYISYEK